MKFSRTLLSINYIIGVYDLNLLTEDTANLLFHSSFFLYKIVFSYLLSIISFKILFYQTRSSVIFCIPHSSTNFVNNFQIVCLIRITANNDPSFTNKCSRVFPCFLCAHNIFLFSQYCAFKNVIYICTFCNFCTAREGITRNKLKQKSNYNKTDKPASNLNFFSEYISNILIYYFIIDNIRKFKVS